MMKFCLFPESTSDRQNASFMRQFINSFNGSIVNCLIIIENYHLAMNLWSEVWIKVRLHCGYTEQVRIEQRCGYKFVC